MNCAKVFRFEFFSALQCLADSDVRLKNGLAYFLALKSWSFQEKQNLLQKLAELVIHQDFVPYLVKHCKPILLEILERAAQVVKRRSEENKSCCEGFCQSLSLLLPLTHLKDFIYRFIKGSCLFSVFSEEEGEVDQSYERILCVLKTCNNLLCYDFETFCNVWDWSPVFELLQHKHPEVRWFAVHIVAMISEMSDQVKLNLVEKCFTIEERNKFLVTECFVKGSSDLIRECMDWEKSHSVMTDSMGVDTITPDGSFFTNEDLVDKYTTICGVVLPRMPGTSNLSDKSLTMVPSTVNNLHSLVLLVASGCGVLLEGPIGSGKTTLVEYVARATGRSSPPNFMKIQLGDQTDSKSLLGTYICTDTPGEFVWQPGPLLQAVQGGHWILLEDIDLAPMDVVSVLIPLLESRTLSVPAHGNAVKAAPGFQLFATQRSYHSKGGSSYQVTSASSAILDKLWTRVQTEPLSKEELTDVLHKRYPELETVATKLVDIYCLLSTDPRLVSSPDIADCSLPHDKRLSSTRDFMKWCCRIAVTACGSTSLLDSKDVFLEAQDCFSSPLPKMEDRNMLDIAVGAKLGLTKEKIEFFFRSYKPKVHISPLSLTVGRITLKRNIQDNKTTHFSHKNLPKYAHTRHSLLLVEKVAACIRNNEPVLLVGETGTGKTSTVQYLAAQCATTLKVVNMSQQSDSSDLLGGYKPVEMKQIVAPVRERFEMLFCKTFSRKQNVKFLSHVQKCFAQGMWEMLFKLMMHSQKNAVERVRKDDRMKHLLTEWQNLNLDIQQLRKQQKNAESALAFRFVEGTLVQALHNGDWVLLDEINLATAETLECLCGLLESSSGSLVLMERGDVTPTTRHEDFRLFACMNPATDVGKKDLPPGIRNRFTEIFVSELEDTADLKTLVVDYLQGLSPNAAIVDGIVRFYLTVKHEANDKLTDGTGHKPHYSLRTLCRALRYAAANPHQNALRSIYEGFCLSFLTQLDRSSHPAVQSLIRQHLLGHVNAASLLKQPLPMPQGSGQFCNFEGFWIAVGNNEPVVSSEYVLTASVKANLKDLSRVVSARKLPVLIQGETSVGKTSLIQWLAKASGNHCVRINNHEHTDIQEYLGCYTSDENGKLVFKEGVLVDAMRKGHWIILDELNLAPSDVLEALNRLLDDNRELFIPETQDTVVAHQMFMLFATQNPPGHYGGRKILSRAFRNRFVELHFDELPSQELEAILHQRCSLPPSYAKKLVAIMLDLQARRRSTNVFAGKQGFITLRDLFRWAERYSKTPDVQSGGFHDWDQHLAEDGYMLLAGRCRNPSECKVIQEVVELHMKCKLDPDLLFGDPSMLKLSPGISSLITQVTTASLEGFRHIVWTHSMRRLAVLAGRALQFGEPVLLVGETGCGKTTICQLFAALWNHKLFAVNCHMHSESADFLGGLRPVRNRGHEEQNEELSKLFEWCDGPLVQAMKEGAMLLVDEISLADDSVLERLNSVLEPERTLVLAEKGGGGLDDVDVLVAHQDFKIIGTMNPGGDFGKKELSPALRNRFTEIWCPPSNARTDLVQIIEHNIKPGVALESASQGSSGIGEAIMDFIEWFHSTDFGKKFVVSTRDLLSWVNFINTCSISSTHKDMNSNTGDRALLSPALAYVHGACLVFLDALGSGLTSVSSSSSSSGSVKDAYQACLDFLRRQVDGGEEKNSGSWGTDADQFGSTSGRPDFFGIRPFFIPRGPLPPPENFASTYTLSSPTSQNAQRVLRALQLPRPILLEGSPGVGKTSLVGAIAKASGHELIRINLSEQTDVTDLFGADLPVEGGEAGQFVWRDGPLLKALKAGHWIVLDELNLASQSVLEGLNACLDHRAEVYIPELGMTFRVQREKTRLFACQNPLNQGGGRKGLPKSFLNRFTQVYVEPLSKSDLLFITEALYPQIDPGVLDKMVTFNMKIHQETVVEGRWGRKGSPWELNLRDVFRWCDLLIKHQSPGSWEPGQFVRLIYCDRMRTIQDKQMVVELFKSVIESTEPIGVIDHTRPSFYITPTHVQVGHSWLPRCPSVNQSGVTGRHLQVLHHCLPAMESLMKCLEMNWMAILVGPRSCGKTSLVHLLAQLTGNRLEVMAMNSAMDTTELLGGFEQADLNRQWGEIVKQTKELVLSVIREMLIRSNEMRLCLQEISVLYKLWSDCSSHENKGCENTNHDMLSREKLDALQPLISSIQKICYRNSMASLPADTILEMLQSLRYKLKANGDSSHCGGQFEWVDGQLVEALKSGYWLLIDNVNFCSPSVLDRLNALLEPGGILTIDERGVIDGKIPSIKPHPNFRLILAMDPRYGEISRAMRNRGVEIFMLGEDDGHLFDEYDKQMMLRGLGLQDRTTCASLVAFHAAFKQSLGGSILDMLHAASLTMQLVLRGSHTEASILTALKQAYVRNQVSERNKEVAEELISKHVSTMSNLENTEHVGAVPECFASSQTYLANSVVSMINLQSLPFLRILKNSPSAVQVEFAVLLFLERSTLHDWKLRLDYLQSFMDSVLDNAPSSCHKDVTTTLKPFTYSFGILFSSHLMGNLKKELKDLKSSQFDSRMLDHFPFDQRLNTDLFKHLKQFPWNASLLARISGIANRLSLLENEARRWYIEEDGRCPTVSPTRNLIHLSHAFHSGQVQLESLPNAAVVHLWPFFKLLSSFLESCISQEDPLSDDQHWTVVDGLVWRDRLWKICEKQSSRNFSISSLSLHWSWVVQHTLNTVPVAFGVLDYRKLPSELVTVINHLSSILGADSRMSEVYFKILSAYGHPPPFRSNMAYQIWEKLQHLCQKMRKFHDNPVIKRGIDETLRELQRKVAVAFGNMIASRLGLEKNGYVQCESSLTNLEEAVNKNQLQEDDDDPPQCEDSSELETDHSKSSATNEVEMERVLLLLFGNICRWQEHSVLGTLMSRLANRMACRKTFEQKEDVEKQLASLTAYQLNKTSIYPDIQAQYQYLQAVLPKGENFKANFCSIFQPVESELLSKYFLFKSNSLWTQNIQGKRVFHDQGFHVIKASVGCLLGGARNMLNSMTSRKLLGEASGPLSSLIIRSYEENIKQLQILSKHIWVNGDVLDNHNEVERWSNIQLFVSKLIQVLLSFQEILSPSSQQSLLRVVHDFLDAIENDNGVESVVDGLKSAVLSVFDNYKQVTGNVKQGDLVFSLMKECLQGTTHLQQKISHDTAEMLLDAVYLGNLWVKLGLAQCLILSPVGPVDPGEKNSIELEHVNEKIFRIEEELKVRYNAEEIWTGLKTGPEKLEALLSQQSWSKTELTSNPLRVQWLLSKLKELKNRVQDLEKNTAFRPPISQFEAILDEVRHYLHTVGDTNSVVSQVDSMQEQASHLLTSLKEGVVGNLPPNSVHSAVHKAKAWYTSAERFVQHLTKEYPLYCDLLAPFVAGISQVIYGVSLVSAKLSTLHQQHMFRVQLPVNTSSKLCAPDQTLLSSLCQFPISSSSSILDVTLSLTTPSVQACIQGLVKYLQDHDMAASASAILSYRVLRLSLLYVRNHSIQHGFVDDTIHSALNSILAIFLDKWEIFKEEQRRREEEEGSLFKFRNKSHVSSLTEDEENKLAVSRAFPSFDEEFKDILAPEDLNDSRDTTRLNDEASQCLPSSDAELFMANMKDFSEIRRVHEEMFSRLPSSQDQSLGVTDCCLFGSVDAQFLEAFQWGYQTAALVNAIIPWSPLEDRLSRSHLLQSCILKGDFKEESRITQQLHSSSASSGARESSPFNVYHDYDVNEIVKVKPVLQDFMVRVQELLAEWPRHPALLQLVVVIERILSFPVTSPLMKILTGLEVLLRKAQIEEVLESAPQIGAFQEEHNFLWLVGRYPVDWESNAAKHVSLKEHLDRVTHLIIQWRRMELKCWSSLLDVATAKAAAKSSQWWFHIYNSLQQFREGEAENETTESGLKGSELIEPLQRFIESSTLGEFSSRVQMLFSFYKEMCYKEDTTSGAGVKVSDVLWNLYSYYKQFVPCIEQSLEETRKPIEKELKGFVKIAKWNDSNFWAMKQAADKSHHTLHKFVRKYESSLDEPVEKTLMNVKKIFSSPEDTKQPQTDDQKTLQAEWFISPDNLKVYCDKGLQFASTYEAYGVCLPSTQARLPKLFQKMRKLSQQILCKRGYIQMVVCLDDFTGEVIATSNELQALDVSNQPKEKRAELRKHIQQRKRKSLSDLFKTLSSIGVSYRKGLNLERQSTGKESMILAAIDEEALTRSISLLSDRSPDLLHEVARLLDGCRHHYFKSLARYAAFTVAIVTPSKELSIGDIDRCKGCSQHLLHVCYEQRKVITHFSRNIRSASVCLKQLIESVSLPDDDDHLTSRRASLPPQTELEQRTVEVMSLLTHTAQVLQQMSILLRCCPSDDNGVSVQEWSPLPQCMLSPLAVSSSSDHVVRNVAQTVEDSAKKVQQLAKDVRPYAALSDHVLKKTSKDDKITFLASWRQLLTVEDAVVKLENISEVIDEMLPKFESKCCTLNRGLGETLVGLKSKILKECRDFQIWRRNILAKDDGHETWNTGKISEQVTVTVNAFLKDVESLNTSLLLAIQRLAKVEENRCNQNTEEGEVADSDSNFENLQLQDGHLTSFLHENLLNEINSLDFDNVTKSVSGLMHRMKDMADSTRSATDEPNPLSFVGLCTQLLGSGIPLLHQYLNLSQHLLVNLLTAHRATSKLLSVLLSIFTDLASRGFCLPPEIEEGEGDGATEFEDIEGGGIGEGEGMKDISDQIENEDQLEEAKQEGQEQDKKEEEQQQIPDEENGIEMSENFDGALHDVEAGEEEDNEKSDEEDEEENDVDKQMGEVDGQETEKLDEKMWGDSDGEDEKEEEEMKEEKGAGAEAESQSQMVAKEDNKGSTDDSKANTDQGPDVDEEQSKPNEADDAEEGNLEDEEGDDEEGTGQQEQQGTQDNEDTGELDLPDDLQLDEEGDEGNNDHPEEMETDDFEGEETEGREPEGESAAADDKETDEREDEQEAMEDEENTEGNDGSDAQEDGEKPEDENAGDESDQEDWRTKPDTKNQPQDNVQAVEDSGEGDGSGEQTDFAAGQSESTDGNEERGVGRAEAADNEGHRGESSTVQATADTSQQSRQRKQMNRARSDRTLGSMDETTHKRLKTVDKTEMDSGAEANETRNQDLFQHIKNDDPSTHGAQTLDSATADQAKEQDKADFPEMQSENEDDKEDEEMKTALFDENEELPVPDRPQQSRLPPPVKPKITADSEAEREETEIATREDDMDTSDGAEISTERLQSTYHSSEMALVFERLGISSLDPEKLRSDLEHQLAEWNNLDRGTTDEQHAAQEAWRKYELLTSSLSQELCEQLRLVLEPSLATKLKGDYRSGKRLNMRKVIPYIASQFRKDKIWLRRTKPSKRQYQIMLAVDDSSSMNENHSKQLAFESLAVISNALTRLEAGDLGVCSFGETVQLLHPFHEPFTDQSGARILQQFTFDQKKTKIAQLLDTCTSLMLSAQSRLQMSPRIRRDTSQLLLIVSDGRGIFLEGMETVQKAVRVAREANIFMVFVILDNPANKDSVLDIRVPIFRPGKPPEIKSYMEQFPFPFYIILRDINALPQILSDALRQWFELVSSKD